MNKESYKFMKDKCNKYDSLASDRKVNNDLINLINNNPEEIHIVIEDYKFTLDELDKDTMLTKVKEACRENIKRINKELEKL